MTNDDDDDGIIFASSVRPQRIIYIGTGTYAYDRAARRVNTDAFRRRRSTSDTSTRVSMFADDARLTYTVHIPTAVYRYSRVKHDV